MMGLEYDERGDPISQDEAETKPAGTLYLEIVTNVAKVEAEMESLREKVGEVIDAVNAIGEPDPVTEARRRAMQHAAQYNWRAEESPAQVVARAAAYTEFLLSGKTSTAIEAPPPEA